MTLCPALGGCPPSETSATPRSVVAVPPATSATRPAPGSTPESAPPIAVIAIGSPHVGGGEAPLQSISVNGKTVDHTRGEGDLRFDGLIAALLAQYPDKTKRPELVLAPAPETPMLVIAKLWTRVCWELNRTHGGHFDLGGKRVAVGANPELGFPNDERGMLDVELHGERQALVFWRTPETGTSDYTQVPSGPNSDYPGIGNAIAQKWKDHAVNDKDIVVVQLDRSTPFARVARVLRAIEQIRGDLSGARQTEFTVYLTLDEIRSD